MRVLANASCCGLAQVYGEARLKQQVAEMSNAEVLKQQVAEMSKDIDFSKTAPKFLSKHEAPKCALERIFYEDSFYAG